MTEENTAENFIEQLDEEMLDLPHEERVVLGLMLLKHIHTRMAELAESGELTGAEKERLEMHSRKARAQIEELQRIWGVEIPGE